MLAYTPENMLKALAWTLAVVAFGSLRLLLLAWAEELPDD